MDASSLVPLVRGSCQLIGLFCCLVVAWLFQVALYRLLFHPLCNYPGPFWGKLTNGYGAYHSWKGDLHLDMLRCHEKYGNHIRYGPSRLLFNTSTALDGTFGTGTPQLASKSKVYLSMMARVPNTVTQRSEILHAPRRRLLDHGFSSTALRSYQDAIDTHIDKFCFHLTRDERGDTPLKNSSDTKQWSPPRNMAHWCDYLAFDIMLDIIYGHQCEMINSAEYRPLLNAIAISNIRVGVMLPLHRWKNTFLDRWLFGSAIIARYEYIGFIKKLLAEKSPEHEAQHGRRTIYDVLMNGRDGVGLSPVEIASESTNLILAGYDTISTTLAASLFYFSRYPDVYRKVTAEVRGNLRSAYEIRDRMKLKACIYLRACIDETLRMAPPVPTAPFREVKSGGMSVDGKHLPVGCDIGTGIYAIHHNPEYFPDPFTFDPKRWLSCDTVSSEATERARCAFSPFSKGPRSCIGKHLAIMELMSVLATLLYTTEFKIPDGKEGKLGEGSAGAGMGRHRSREYQLYNHVTAARKGPVLQFRACND